MGLSKEYRKPDTAIRLAVMMTMGRMGNETGFNWNMLLQSIG